MSLRKSNKNGWLGKFLENTFHVSSKIKEKVNPNLEVILNCGGKLSADIAQDLCTLLNINYCQGYGLTETGGGIFGNHAKDQIVNNKIEQYRWRKEKSINTESNKPFLQAKMKKDKKQLQYTSLKKENLKTYGIILKILQRINNFFTEIIKNIPEVELAIGKHSISNSYIDVINNIPELELSLGKYLDDKLRKIHNKFSKKKKK